MGDDDAPLEDEPTENLLIPAFPGSRAFQLRFESDFVPNASIDHKNEVSSYGPSTRLRIAGPVSERVGLQLVAKYGVHFYDFEGSTDFFATGRRSGDPFDELHEAGVRLQAAFNLNDDAHVFAPSETWSLFTEVGGGTRREGSAVDQGFVGGGALALGYELPKHLELAV